MELMSNIIFGIYTFALGYVTLYCLLQLHLLFHYRRVKKSPEEVADHPFEEYPLVTIQLPMFNERFVVSRLIDNITQLDYPKDRFDIQVLDDSTDETVDIAKEKVAEYKAKGFNIEHITREKRQGYKAGALKDAMKYVKGEFVAIFDADFLPEPDFLKQTLPHFADPKIGVVQTRWGHINQKYSLLTELQAFQLNVHFTVEQLGRWQADYLLQFNGTAGLWRKATIESAGGWEADTLTEDLDLSYRAQLKGWKIKYLEDILSPAELPAEMHGLKSQQFRWMKGGAETARKMLPTVWGSDLPFWKKIHASGHLMGSSVFIFIFILGVFSVPVIYYFNPLGLNASFQNIFFIGFLAMVLVYYQANVKTAWKNEDQSTLKMLFKFIVLFPVFLSISMGLSFHNTIAVMQGYLGRKSAFVRTPKFNINTISDTLKKSKYTTSKISLTTVIEGLLAVYFVYGIYLGFKVNDFSLTMFHSLLAIGYSFIFYYSIRHLYLK